MADDFKSSFGSRRGETEEFPTSFWGHFWGTYWFELFILIVFILALSAIFLPFLAERFVLTIEYLIYVVKHVIRPIIIAIDVIITGMFIFAMVKGWPYRPPLTLFEKVQKGHEGHGAEEHKEGGDETVIAAWARVKEKSAVENIESIKLALIEADTLVDHYLQKLGYEGETMAERLQHVSPSEAESLEGVWAAHKLRNEAVHNPGFNLRIDDARDGIISIGKFLKELGALK